MFQKTFFQNSIHWKSLETLGAMHRMCYIAGIGLGLTYSIWRTQIQWRGIGKNTTNGTI